MKTNNKIQMFAVAAVALAAVACTDTWDEHYGNEGRPVSDKSLLQVMEEQGDLGDFLKVLRATHVFSNNKPTKVTYADLLASDFYCLGSQGRAVQCGLFVGGMPDCVGRFYVRAALCTESYCAFHN